MEVLDLLLSRAGITKDHLRKTTTDIKFLEILSALSKIHTGKSYLYGNYIETHGDDPTKFALMEHYSDVKRKFIRADTFMKKFVGAGEEIDLVELLDTYSDMAVYAAMGVQLVLYKLEKQNATSTQPERTTGM